MPPTMLPVDSAICTHVGYDEEKSELYMEHDNGRTSIFGSAEQPLPPDIANYVMTSDSVGKAFHAAVRGQFPHRYMA